MANLSIYSATYSNVSVPLISPLLNSLLHYETFASLLTTSSSSKVPVYEFNVEGNHVMRRRSDDWINATHILKVANFDKPARTRILEREVQKGVHEKVQGGYGKYQGKLRYSWAEALNQHVSKERGCLFWVDETWLHATMFSTSFDPSSILSPVTGVHLLPQSTQQPLQINQKCPSYRHMLGSPSRMVRHLSIHVCRR